MARAISDVLALTNSLDVLDKNEEFFSSSTTKEQNS